MNLVTAFAVSLLCTGLPVLAAESLATARRGWRYEPLYALTHAAGALSACVLSAVAWTIVVLYLFST